MLVYGEYFNTRVFIYILHKHYQMSPSSFSVTMSFNGNDSAIPVDKVVELVDQLTFFQCAIEQFE